jgi:hypothetical protein
MPPPVQAHLPGLKHNAYSAAGDLAEDLVITEVADAGRLRGTGLRRRGDPRLTVASRICLFGLIIQPEMLHVPGRRDATDRLELSQPIKPGH